jgi:uncharacterized DUF497 family protein
MTISRYPHSQMCCFKQNIRVFGVRINVDVITFSIYNKIKIVNFEWDENKNEVNIRKHGVDFNDIPEIFDGPMIINFDDRVDYNEERYMGIGVLRNIIAVVVFVEKGEDVIRIISARKANNHESKTFEKEIKNRLG